MYYHTHARTLLSCELAFLLILVISEQIPWYGVMSADTMEEVHISQCAPLQQKGEIDLLIHLDPRTPVLSMA
jgi:hypothetical protein